MGGFGVMVSESQGRDGGRDGGGGAGTWLAPVAGVALVALGPAWSCRRAREERSIVDAAAMLKWGANACRLSGSVQISNCESGRGEEAATGSKRAGGISWSHGHPHRFRASKRMI